MIATNAVFKPNLLFSDRAHERKPLIRSGQEAKKMRAEIDRDNSTAKSSPTPDFLRAEPANTPVFIHAEKRRGIMSRRDEIVKKRRRFRRRDRIEWTACRHFGPVRRYSFQTVFVAFATGWDSFPRRFSRKAANMALARAGKRRCIRSMR
jgi:hypothetical protein